MSLDPRQFRCDICNQPFPAGKDPETYHLKKSVSVPFGGKIIKINVVVHATYSDNDYYPDLCKSCFPLVHQAVGKALTELGQSNAK
jgi:hypothetical protein